MDNENPGFPQEPGFFLALTLQIDSGGMAYD
jgi:hypothetical protein